MATRSKKNTHSRIKQFAGIRLLFVIAALIVFHSFNGSPHSNYRITGNQAVLIAGFVAFLLGLSLAIWARVYLGKNWGTPMSQKRDPELVTAGPYHYIRHPIYSGILLAAVGSAMASGFYWAWLLVFAGPYFIYSAVVEEKMAVKQFPKAYPAYKSKTKMLIPFIF